MKPLEVRRTDPFDETLFPLSAAQRATWFAQQFDPEVPILIAHYVELRGELDVELLDRETRAVAYEFQSPMLKVIEVDGQPMQYVDEKAEISVGLVDFRWTEDPFEAALEWMRRDCRTQLDLAVDGIVATAVLRVGDAHYLWYSRIHHVALDGFGAMTMMNRIAHRYSASAARKICSRVVPRHCARCTTSTSGTDSRIDSLPTVSTGQGAIQSVPDPAWRRLLGPHTSRADSKAH